MTRIVFSVLFLALVPLACYKAPPPAPAMPPAPQAQCLDFSRASGSPLTVNLSGHEQALLQNKLKQDGIVLVHYDCNNLNVLDRCAAIGSYGYAGIEPQLDQVRLSSDQDVAINLGSGIGFLASVGGGFSQQKTLDLAVMTVGSVATPINVQTHHF